MYYGWGVYRHLGDNHAPMLRTMFVNGREVFSIFAHRDEAYAWREEFEAANELEVGKNLVKEIGL